MDTNFSSYPLGLLTGAFLVIAIIILLLLILIALKVVAQSHSGKGTSARIARQISYLREHCPGPGALVISGIAIFSLIIVIIGIIIESWLPLLTMMNHIRIIEPFRSANQWFDDGPFDDTSQVLQSGLTVSGFRLSYGNIVDSMQALSGKQHIALTAPHGEVTPQSTEITLPPGDSWSRISGFYGDWFGGSYVLQLTFHTRQGRTYGPFGNMNYSSSQIPFSLDIGPNERILALKGIVSFGDNSAHRHIGALGLVLQSH